MIPEHRIREEFELIINTRGVYRPLKMTENQVRQLRKSYKEDKVSEGKMLEVLNRAGGLELRLPDIGPRVV